MGQYDSTKTRVNYEWLITSFIVKSTKKLNYSNINTWKKKYLKVIISLIYLQWDNWRLNQKYFTNLLKTFTKNRA